MLRDSHERVISYLRIGVTDRCNFRCTYCCMPAEGTNVAPREDLLTFEELARVVRVGARLGLAKVRLTGGEPTVRHDLPRLVMMAAVLGVLEIAKTANASRLEASALKRAGLKRVNISLDTLRPERAREIARRDYFDDVMRGVEAAVRVGFDPLKFNAVVIRGMNDDELCDLVRFADARGAQMRFIEYMPMGSARNDSRNKTIMADEMLALLREQFDFVLEPTSACANDPARAYVCRRSGARVGFHHVDEQSFLRRVQPDAVDRRGSFAPVPSPKRGSGRARDYARAANVYVDALLDDAVDLPARLPSRAKHEGVRRVTGD